MVDTKTKPTKVKVEDFLRGIIPEERKRDGFTILRMMQKATNLPAYMWGPSIVGFGQYHYKYESGHEGDAPLIGFSPRKNALTLYVMFNFEGSKDLFGSLGKYTKSKACLYIKRLSDIDMNVLQKIIERSFQEAKRLHT